MERTRSSATPSTSSTGVLIDQFFSPLNSEKWCDADPRAFRPVAAGPFGRFRAFRGGAPRLSAGVLAALDYVAD